MPLLPDEQLCDACQRALTIEHAEQLKTAMEVRPYTRAKLLEATRHLEQGHELIAEGWRLYRQGLLGLEAIP